MTTINVSKKVIKSAKMNGESSLPTLESHVWRISGYTAVDERDDFFVGYGIESTSFPYKEQNMYSEELYDTEVDTIVLENEYLKAEFWPELGGKLVSLIDKQTGKDLLFYNPVIRPRNLARRNAWTSGGVEWNCGIFAHHVHTCDRLFTAITKLEDGTPVLRMYEYERIRKVVYQMDFFLPEGSKLLFARMRITNTTPRVTPIYWWSNIAVPTVADGRVIVPTDFAYANNYQGSMALIPVPYRDGNELSYPDNIPRAADYFYKLPDNKRKFECYVNGDGYGIVQCSTSRQKGRKLFVWGQGAGSEHWQKYLTDENTDGHYIEIQAGLAYSQWESLPMPPATTWEWLEGYGAIKGDADKMHAEWKDAQIEATRALDEIISDQTLEEMLESTYKMATTPADELLFKGSGWYALENARREKCGERKFATHLDFGDIDYEQACWKSLLDDKTILTHDESVAPISFMYQPEWTAMLENACRGKDKENWYAHYQLATIYFTDRRIKDAKVEINRSYKLKPTAWALNVMSKIALAENHKIKAASYAVSASKMLPDDLCLTRYASECVYKYATREMCREYVEWMEKQGFSDGRVRLNMALSYIKLENIEKAQAILFADDFEVTDIREGDNILTEVYVHLERLRAKKAGMRFNKKAVLIPEKFDFRMSENPDKKAITVRATAAIKRAKRVLKENKM